MKQSDQIQLAVILEELAKTCVEKSMMLATAESCTGGGIAYEITSIPGSSHWFERGFVTYSNLSKIQMLGVQESTLNECGAVSEEVATEMVEGAIKFSAANVSLAITGIAGPEGGSEKKTGGYLLVWLVNARIWNILSAASFFRGSNRDSKSGDSIFFKRTFEVDKN